MTQAQTPPAPPPVPGLAGPGVTIAGQNGATTMLSARDVAALRKRGEELSRQLNSATGRRDEVKDALRQAVGADQRGLEQRLTVLDNRISRLETDIDENGKQLASLPAALATSRGEQFGGFNSGRSERTMDRAFLPLSIIFTLFVLTPIAVSIARIIWKRGSLRTPPLSSPENNQRLERMEQALDAIAIEVERVSEGQRFVTRLMSEGRQGALVGEGQPAAQAVPVPRSEPVSGRR